MNEDYIKNEDMLDDVIIIPEGEEPEITVERDEEDVPQVPTPHRRLPWIVGSILVTLLVCITAVLGWKFIRQHYYLGVPVSVTSAENIKKLEQVPLQMQAGVVVREDSVLGVDLRFYELQGLKAEISMQEPSPKDKDVYLYSRCSDHTTYDKATNHYLGSLVVQGKELESDVSRLGYCAMANDNVVIGVARNEDVKDYVIENGGSFFRQFILVSDHEIPTRFFLHGKVERRAIGRIKDKLYYIETLNRETLWDFADALREYGFTDAIYITGGDEYSYYRTADGQMHDLGNPEHRMRPDAKGIVPYLVFKKR